MSVDHFISSTIMPSVEYTDGTRGYAMDAEWFGERLRELREKAGLTQQQLAERANLTRAGVAQLETGRREPAWRTVVVLCEALGVACDEFLRQPARRSPVMPGRPRK